MSYVSSDSRLWFNMPGVQVAYQPINATGQTFSFYNMANGGSDRYKGTASTKPDWSAKTGWRGKTGSNNIITGLAIPSSCKMTVLVRGIIPSGVWRNICSSNPSGDMGIRQAGTTIAFTVHIQATTISGVISGNSVYGLTSGIGSYQEKAFVNGLVVATNWTVNTLIPNDIMNCGPNPYNTDYVYAIAWYYGLLSDAQVFSASQQMQYCDVNPDWSAWGRRRQWYYAPTGAADINIRLDHTDETTWQRGVKIWTP